MQFWATFWGLLLLASITVFAVLAVAVTIGGFRDTLALFRDIATQTADSDSEE